MGDYYPAVTAFESRDSGNSIIYKNIYTHTYIYIYMYMYLPHLYLKMMLYMGLCNRILF